MQSPIPRRQQILETLAAELEKSPGERITTASLARAAGVSEAALYRHFPSKAKMFEALISFAEESVFSRINQILEEDREAASRCYKLLYLLLGFADRNPGITRVLLGDALVGENERLQSRVEKFFDRLQTQFRQVLREVRLREGGREVAAEEGADLLLAFVEGRLRRFLRSHFKHSPLQGWEGQWKILGRAILE
jgi:TetR/AcrR family transcriptional regulator